MTTISPVDGSVPISIHSGVIVLSVQMRSTMHDTTSTRPEKSRTAKCATVAYLFNIMRS